MPALDDSQTLCQVRAYTSPSPFREYPQMRSAMRHRLRRCPAIAAFAIVLASLPLTELASPPLSRADDGCGPGMSYNYETLDCEPWVDVDPYIDPYIPVPIPIGIQSTST